MSEVQYRELELDATRADSKRRTIDANLSSVEPVERVFGYEVLSYDRSAIDMRRAKSGLPLLFSHDPEQPIGLVNDIRIEGGKLVAALASETRHEPASSGRT